MGLRMNFFLTLWVLTEKSDRGDSRKPIYRGNRLKKGAYTVCGFQRGAWQKRGG